jgi:hypothetical protein
LRQLSRQSLLSGFRSRIAAPVVAVLQVSVSPGSGPGLEQSCLISMFQKSERSVGPLTAQLFV